MGANPLRAAARQSSAQGPAGQPRPFRPRSAFTARPTSVLAEARATRLCRWFWPNIHSRRMLVSW